MPLRVYNTLTQEKETFRPIHDGKVGMYVCGPTVYSHSHIGHMVGPVIFDTIKRYLTYAGYDVTWVDIPVPDPDMTGMTNNAAIVAVGDQGRARGAAQFSRLEGATWSG